MSYSTAQAARLCGCTPRQLDAWRELGLVEPSAPGAEVQYSFRDLVALRMVASLLDAGLPMTRIKRAIGELVRAGEDLSALALVTDGDAVFACRDDGQILDALRHGQLALFVAVDRLADQVSEEVKVFDAERSAFVADLGVEASARDAHPSRGRRP